jgi:hypothetical protein
MRTQTLFGAALLLAFACTVNPAKGATEQVLDDCSDVSRWEVVASDGVRLDLDTRDSADSDGSGRSALQLDVDFESGAGFAGIRRKIPIELPENFELAFTVRGDLPPNNLEFKLVDASGQNVWWVNRRGFEFPRQWTRLKARRRHFQFAWGPSAKPISRAGALEIVVAAAEGGRGSIWIDDVTFRPLPVSKPYAGTPKATASSEAGPGFAADHVIDGDSSTVWKSNAGDARPLLTIDFSTPREFGGLVIHWDENAYPARYDVQLSDDSQNWSTVRSVAIATGRPQFISLPDAEASAVRVVMNLPKPSASAAIRDIEILGLETSHDANALAMEIARRAPRGHYPRAMRGEGNFWTIIGVPGDEHEALVSEDGAIEVDKLAFSIEPFLFVDGKLLTWNEATITQSLANAAPVPTVTRDHAELQLEVTAAADGPQGNAVNLLCYTVTNKSAEPVAGAIFLAMRPFQVNPPYQWLNTVGGVARVEQFSLDDSRHVLEIDGRAIVLSEPPQGFGSATFDEGEVITYLINGEIPVRVAGPDPVRAASAALRYSFELAAGESRSWSLLVPTTTSEVSRQKAIHEFLAVPDPVAHVRRRQRDVADAWRRATSTFELLVPPEAAKVVDTIHSNLAYILINQDGDAIHPGSRSYERAWIRDGSLTATALMRFGLPEHARDFVDWYAAFQFDSGKIPCVVDRRGPDPVPENDSHGQFIMAVMNVYRFTKDESFLRKHWPRVKKTVAYIESLRAQRMTPDYTDPHTTEFRQEPNKPPVSLYAFHGLVPESISHEGYSAKPMHSYWDDFFTLRGLKDAAEMAGLLEEAEAKRFRALAEDFAASLYASINAAMRIHDIDYIPGSVELGDFDATSTTVALWPCGELGRLPRPALDRTFELYWDRFLRRRDDPAFDWVDYTPYEVRCIGAMVLLGQIDRAHEAMRFFLNDRRPPAWNQWPEVVHRNPRTAKFVGDLPHTWCGSDFLNSIRMMFLFEREEDDALVLLAGIPPKWVSSRPVGFRDMPTYGGRISCTLARHSGNSDQLVANISGNCPIPDGGIRLTIPGGAANAADVNDHPAETDTDGRVVVRSLPAEVTIDR